MPKLTCTEQKPPVLNKLLVVALASAVAACTGGTTDESSSSDVAQSSSSVAPPVSSSIASSSSVAPVPSSSSEAPVSSSEPQSSSSAAPVLNSLLNSSGTFDNGMENFSFQTNGGATGSVAWQNEANVTINGTSSENWHIQVIHDLSVIDGTDYAICFSAKAVSARDIKVAIDAGMVGNYADLVPPLDASLTTSYQDFKHVVRATGTDDTARLVFNLGLSDANVQLDNIGVYAGSECSGTGTPPASSSVPASSSSAPVSSSSVPASSSSAPVQSSSVASSSSSAPSGYQYDDADFSVAEAQYNAQSCSGCHTYQGDGIFTALSQTIDLNPYMAAGKFNDLVQVVNDTMAPNNPTGCVTSDNPADNCAVNTSAWMVKFLLEDTGSELSCDADTPVGHGFRTLRMLSRSEYINTLQDLQVINAGQLTTDDLPNDALATKSGFTANTVLVADESRLQRMMDLAGTLAESAATSFRQREGCGTNAQQCSDKFLTFAERAYRRPLEQSEKDALAQVFTDFGAEDGTVVAFKAVLSAPQFLYRSELGISVSEARQRNLNLGTNDAGQNIIDTLDADTYILEPYEMATALAYMYTGSTPDATLMASAANGRVYSQSDVTAIVSRLIGSDQAKAHMREFGATWFRADDVVGVERPDVPSFNGDIANDMAQEVRELFGHVFFGNNVPFSELYAGDYAVVNKRLADYYGATNFSGGNNDWVATQIPNRGGVLTTGSFTAANAGRDGSGPIKRAVDIRELMLCHHIGAPPNDLDSNDQRAAKLAEAAMLEESGNLTQRKYFELVTEGGSCDACHEKAINPLFGVDDFDEAGRFRTTQTGRGDNGIAGLAIDNTGTLYGLDSIQDTATLDFAGSKDLGQKISELDAVEKCLVVNSFRYATGMPIDDKSYSLDEGGNNNEPVTLTDDQKESFACMQQDLLNTLNTSGGSAKAVYEMLGGLEPVMFRKVIQANQFPNQ